MGGACGMYGGQEGFGGETWVKDVGVSAKKILK